MKKWRTWNQKWKKNYLYSKIYTITLRCWSYLYKLIESRQTWTCYGRTQTNPQRRWNESLKKCPKLKSIQLLMIWKEQCKEDEERKQLIEFK